MEKKQTGCIVELPDGRLAIVYNRQPLAKKIGKIIIHLVDKDYNVIYDNDKPKILIRDIEIYNEEMRSSKLIGFVN